MTLDALIWLDESDLDDATKGRLLRFAMGGDVDAEQLREYGYVPPSARETVRPAVRDHNPAGNIYFVRSSSGPIKIGFTTLSVEARVRGIQSATPDKLTILGAIEGRLSDEAALLERFANHRISGEWFHPDVILFAIEHGTMARFVARSAEED